MDWLGPARFSIGYGGALAPDSHEIQTTPRM